MTSNEDDIICTLWLYKDSDSLAKKAIEASPLYNPSAQLSTNPHEVDWLADSTRQQDPKPKSCVCGSIQVSFSHPPRSPVGFTIGASGACDMPLPVSGISEYHLAITFDIESRLVIRDLNSTHGTKIIDESGSSRLLHGSEWPFNERPNERCFKISVHPSVWFKLLLTESDFTLQKFAERIQKFREGAKSSAPKSLAIKNEFATTPRLPRNIEENKGEFLDENLEVERAIGKGNSGSVVLATAVKTGRKVVIKEPKDWKEIEGQPKRQARAVENFKKEAAIMRRLNHPNIVKLYHAEFLPVPRLLVEWIPQGSLGENKSPPFTEEEALQILEQSLEALVHMHNQRPSPIVHRDVSPGNILVAKRSREGLEIKLADFGLAKEGMMGSIVGTKPYMAPEISHTIFYTEKIDIWSLGVVLLGLLCQLPGLEPALQSRLFNNKTYAGLVRETFEEAWAENEGLSKVIWSTLDEMLRTNPSDRWSAAKCLELIQAHQKDEYQVGPTQDQCQLSAVTPGQVYYNVPGSPQDPSASPADPN